MAKTKLTDSYIKHIKAPDKRQELYDEKVQGLAVRITPTGHKSFVYRYRFGNRVKRFTIGKYGQVSLSQARKISKDLYVKVAQGIDPLEEKKRKQNKPERFKFGQLVEVFKKQHLSTLKPSTRKEYERIIDNELLEAYKWKNKPVEEITSHEVRKVLNKKAYEDESFTMANRIRSMISKIFDFGMKRVGLQIDKNPVEATAIFEQGENVRDRVYTEDEIQKLWKYWEGLREPMQSVYKILLLTGQRKNEVLNMRWDNIEPNKQCRRISIAPDGRTVPKMFKANVWTILDTKNGQVHEVPLSDMAMEIIEALRPISGESDFVFESPRIKGQPLRSLRNIDQDIKKTTVSDFRIHDLRRTFGTKTEETGVDFSVIKKILNHKDGDVTSRHYTWYNYIDKKLEALNRWSFRLQSIIDDKKETPITRIG